MRESREKIEKAKSTGAGSRQQESKTRLRGQRRRSAAIEPESQRGASSLTVLFLPCERLGIAAAGRAPARLEGARAAARPLEVIVGDISSFFFFENDRSCNWSSSPIRGGSRAVQERSRSSALCGTRHGGERGSREKRGGETARAPSFFGVGGRRS